MTKQQAEIAAVILRESVKAMGQVPFTGQQLTRAELAEWEALEAARYRP